MCLYVGSRCSGDSPQDVIFVIDTSGSIGSSRFQLIKDYTANIITELIRSSPNNAVGVILFATSAHIEFNLQAHASLSTLLSAIDNLPYSGGRTDTAEALTLLLSTAKSGALGLRNNSTKVVIVITDGKSNSRYATISAAAALHTSNMFDVYAVGVEGANLNELQVIASSPEFVLFTSSFYTNGLQQLQSGIISHLCTGMLVNMYSIFMYIHMHIHMFRVNQTVVSVYINQIFL